MSKVVSSKTEVKEPKTLYLNVTQQAFDVMVTGDKKFEFRRPSPWIMSRVKDEHGNPKFYDQVKIVAGYGSNRPFFIADYKGLFEFSLDAMILDWSNGLHWELRTGDVVIMLGEIKEVGNISDFNDVVDAFAYAIHQIKPKINA